MSSLKKFMNAAAGTAAASASSGVYVEDVFSTYLYTGNGSAQTIENGIALGDFGLGTSTEFDGTSDYLSKSYSAGAFGSGSKTFTFSAWVWWDGTTSETIFQFTTFLISANQPSGNILTVSGYSNTYATIFGGQTNAALNKNSWNHLLISIDLSNTSNRYIYINDTSASATYPTYTDTAIGFDLSGLATISSFSAPWTGKLAHVYLDYTYRDLSVVSNRRLFIDANGSSTAPSTLSALSPILYLPMTEDYTIGKNLGTGGDFTANGSPTIVQSGTEYQVGYGAGGLVWSKGRDDQGGNQIHCLIDTSRGGGERLSTDSSAAAASGFSNLITAFNSNGYSFGSNPVINQSAKRFVSWTFRKAPKFFDVVTYTGNGTAGRTISHNLGSVPGCIIIKCTNQTETWLVYHRGSDANPEDFWLQLDATNAKSTAAYWNNTLPTSTEFTIGGNAGPINQTTGTYVAYLFAHNDGDGGFGESGDQDIIKCGSYTGYGSTNSINLGFEPQFLIIKRIDQANQWMMMDVMRGLNKTSDNALCANTLSQEAGDASVSSAIDPTATGFTLYNANSALNVSGGTYIYIAIRRGPMRTPTSGSEVFATGINTTTAPEYVSNFIVDMAFHTNVTYGSNPALFSRLTNTYAIQTNKTNAEYQPTTVNQFDYMNGWGKNQANNTNYRSWMFRRAPSFFDVVRYTGDSSTNRQIAHNLGSTPACIIVKVTSISDSWQVYHTSLGQSQSINLNSTSAAGAASVWGTTPHSSTHFTVSGGYTGTNLSGQTYVAYLFATLSGISKVGSYTGNGTSQNINCGFSAGARFVLIKRTDDTGDWHLWDTARGIVTGNDPFLELNTTNADDSSYDSVDPYSAGFSVNQDSGTNINVSSGAYIFLAIS